MVEAVEHRQVRTRHIEDGVGVLRGGELDDRVKPSHVEKPRRWSIRRRQQIEP